MLTIKRTIAAAAAALAISVGGSAAAQTLCTSNNARGCWQKYEPGPRNFSSSFDVTTGLFCAELGIESTPGENKIVCSVPSGSAGFAEQLFLNNSGVIPGGVDGLALFKAASDTYIHVLGNDDVLRTYKGNAAPATWYSQPNFITPFSTAQPIDVDTNATIGIVEIAAVYSGWLGPPQHTVMAVSTTGVAYTKYGAKWKKHPRLNTLGLTFKRVSSQKTVGGSYWAASTGAIWMAYDLNSAPGPSLVQQPAYSGQIRDLGFPYILTNAGGVATCNPLVSNCFVSCTVSTRQGANDSDRVQRLVSGSWVRSPQQFMNYVPGMPGPVPAPDTGGDVNAFGPKSIGIVDGRSFRNADGEYYIHHYSNQIFAWIP